VELIKDLRKCVGHILVIHLCPAHPDGVLALYGHSIACTPGEEEAATADSSRIALNLLEGERRKLR